MTFPFKEVTCDASIIIELVLSGTDSALFQSISKQEIFPFTTILAITEAEYILCRKLGKKTAFDKIQNLTSSNYFEIINLDDIHKEASLLKCHRSISLPDCFIIALAKEKKTPALFAYKEEELIKQLKTKPFDIQILFLEDLNLTSNED